MMLFRSSIVALVVGSATAQGACGTTGFNMAGSSTVYPVALVWSQKYGAQCAKKVLNNVDAFANILGGTAADILVAGGGSGQGASLVCKGTVDIGNMSRDWKAGEATSVASNGDAWNFVCVTSKIAVTRVDVAIDGVTVVVAKSGTGATCLSILKGLTPDQLRFMYSPLTRQALLQTGWSASALAQGTGAAGDPPLWSTLNKNCQSKEFNLSGPDQANSGTSDFFKEKIFKSPAETLFDSTGSRGYKGSVDDNDTLNYVKNDDAAIGFFGYAYYFSNSGVVVAAPIKNRLGIYTLPSKATILSNDYNPLTRRIFMNTAKASLPQTRPFLEYGYSASGDADVVGTGYDPIPAADQILMLSRIGSNSGIVISAISCESNGKIRIGFGDSTQRSRFNVWSLLYTAKCPKVDIGLINIPTTPDVTAQKRTCSSATDALEVGASSTKSSFAAGSPTYVLSCPSPSTKKLIELIMAPGLYAYVNNAGAVLPTSRGFLRFCLSPVGTILLNKLSLTPNDAATNTNMLTRIQKPSGLCFSGDNSVEVLDRGEVAMKDLAIGDMVKVAEGKFSKVYSFGHYEQDVEAPFLSIDAGLEKPLVISADHMVFVEDKAVAASMVVVGDKLSVVGGFATVKAIKDVTAAGLFAPFTKEGSIVVNSVVASSYVNLKGDSSLVIGGIFAFDLHSLAHMAQAPHRLVCEISSTFCASETYNNGISVWVETPLALSHWLVKQNPLIMTVVFVPAFAFVFLAAATETVFSSPALLFVMVATALFMARKTKKSA